MSGESIESLLEFLRISSRVAVVQLEPPRARAFAEVLERPVTEKGIADRAAAHWEGVAASRAMDVATAECSAANYKLLYERVVARGAK